MRLPDFLVLGALKCGTSSLHSYFGAHPALYTSPRLKEINYFAYDPEANSGAPAWARTQQEYAAFFEDAPSDALVGEVAPVYLASALAPARIHDTIPDAKLIAVLRDPVQRAWSHYLMTVRSGRRALDPEDAFADPTRNYIRLSYYADSLARYYDRFPPEQIKVVLFERLQHERDSVMSELFDFLGVDTSFRPPPQVRGRGYVPRSTGFERLLRHPLMLRARSMLPSSVRSLGRGLRSLNARPAPELPPSVRERTRGWFDEDMHRVEALTGLDVSGWRAGAAAADNERAAESEPNH